MNGERGKKEKSRGAGDKSKREEKGSKGVQRLLGDKNKEVVGQRLNLVCS